jgi:hypothetical protein
MKPLLLLSVMLFTAKVAAQSGFGAPSENTARRNRLVGAWKLVSLEEPDADGRLHKADCAGMFVFTPDGRASVQVMYRNAGTGNLYAHGGYEASYGSYRIDSASAFTFHVEGALVRALIGKDWKRAYEISAEHLTVKPLGENENWKAIWERY